MKYSVNHPRYPAIKIFQSKILIIMLLVDKLTDVLREYIFLMYKQPVTISYCHHLSPFVTSGADAFSLDAMEAVSLAECWIEGY